MDGIVSDIKRMSVHDGPGIRTTMFLKGCPLRCLWCHNPENLTSRPTISFTRKLCIGCGLCMAACPQGVHQIKDGHTLHYESCTGCGQCVQACLTGALTLFGKTMTPVQTAERLWEDKVFFDESNGGVTFSGGEPLVQSRFLAETLEILKRKGIHTAVDTCGEAPWEAFAQILPYTDLFLYDIKHMDSHTHKKLTGVGNERILENLYRLCEAGAQLEIRTPVIPHYNDTDENLQGIATLLSGLHGITAWRLLPYHSMAAGKYEAIGMANPMPETQMPTAEKMTHLRDSLRNTFPLTYLSED